MTVTLIFSPERISRGGYPCAGPIRLPVAANPEALAATKGAKARPGNVELEMKATVLVPGTNTLKDEEYEALQRSPWFGQFLSEQAIALVSPVQTPEAQTGLSIDFSEADALRLVRGSEDLEWLQRCQMRESRDSILKILNQKIRRISEKLSGVASSTS